MPRKLPWLDGDSKAATPRPAKRQRIETPTLDDASATPRRAGRQSTLARADRTPSSSPPPQPPSQEFMKDGLSGDDIWIMVEDEFLATANLYTQHLHHAEYHRLKRLARDRAASNNEMFRAVDRRTTMSGETRRILESHQRDSLQSRVLPEVPGWDEADVRKDDSSDEEAPWMHDSHLSDLMGGYRETSAHLSQLTGARSNTRAAAGFSVAQHVSPKRGYQKARVSTMAGLAREIEQAAATDDEDDLDAPVRRPLITSTTPMAPSSAPRSLNKGASGNDLPREQKPSLTAKATVATEFQRREQTSSTTVDLSTFEKPAQSQPRANAKPARKLLTSQFSWDDDFPKRSALPQISIGRATKPKVDEQKKEEKEKKTCVTLDEIPTFLF